MISNMLFDACRLNCRHAPFKCEPISLGAAALLGGSSLLSTIGNFFSGKDTQSKQIALSREQMAQQREENQLNRDWSEKMWNAENAYNSPSAMMSRLEEAGLNPFLVDEKSSGFGAAGAPSSPSMVGQGSVPNLVSPRLDLAESSLILNAQKVNAESANQKAQAESSIISALAQAYKELGKDGFRAFAETAAPYMLSVNPDTSYWSKEMRSRIYNMDMDSLNKELQLNLGEKFGATQIAQSIQESNYRVSEIVGRLNSMRIQNDALIDKTAADCVRAYADAWHLKKVGEKYVADTKTANALRQYLVGSAKAIMYRDQIGAGEDARSFILGTPIFETQTNERETGRRIHDVEITNEQRSSDLIRALDKVFGEYVNVSVGKNNVQGAYESNSNSTINNVPHNSSSW